MKYLVTVSAIFLLVLAGCATPPSPRESGTVTGAAVGAATGAILGGIAGAPGRGAAIGAAVGAVTGALTGDAIQSEQADRASASRYAYATPPYPPPSGTLQIEVTPEDAEIFVDGRRVGLAKELRGPGVVPVVAGFHLVELHWRGFSVTSHIVVPPQTTVLLRRDLEPSAPALP
ncbi:glycine zipper domain-containing protein [Candidatus Methylomirabilis sp.]|uniref:YMGG-like glycine zipper-containing protein n=1 Tax=Candidatus Methylomirabilis sp. TaxID=2032687 RepID=UPI002A618FA2|nr:glycine zipper domain-containing protein [Candidatus Methylomirabilis sp.]